MNEITFTVFSRPQPQGSTRPFTVKTKNGFKTVVTSANKNLKPWRQELAWVAGQAMAGEIIVRPHPVSISVEFYFDRPASLPKKIRVNTKRPDLDKLCRALCDSLIGICYEDDSQIVRLCASKAYGAPERTEVRVSVEDSPLFDPKPSWRAIEVEGAPV